MDSTVTVRYLAATLGIVALLVVALAPRIASGQAPLTAEEAGNAYIEARNSGDIEGALALFAPGGSFQGAGQCAQSPCAGEALRAQLQREIALHIAITVLETETASDDSAAMRVEVRNDRIRQCGVERVISTETYTVDAEGKILTVVAAPDASDPDTAKFLACPPPQPPATPGSPTAGTGLAEPSGAIPALPIVAIALLIVGTGAAALALRRSSDS